MIDVQDETTVDTDEGIEEPFTDDELAALALAADPEGALDLDAVPVSEVIGSDDLGLLPAWYMPSPMLRHRRLEGWRRRLVIALIIGFLLIDAGGLCFTYGVVE